jgi:hypothetical protein
MHVAVGWNMENSLNLEPSGIAKITDGNDCDVRGWLDVLRIENLAILWGF